MAVESVFVFAYDVSQDSVRRRISGFLEKHGTRVQESVFEIFATQRKADALLRHVDGLRDGGDRVRMYCLTRDGLDKSRSLGGTPLPEQTEFWLL